MGGSNSSSESAWLPKTANAGFLLGFLAPVLALFLLPLPTWGALFSPPSQYGDFVVVRSQASPATLPANS